jgi:hypothetical protein
VAVDGQRRSRYRGWRWRPARWRAGVGVHPAAHLPMPSNNDQHVTPEDAQDPRDLPPELPLSVAYVPFLGKGLRLIGERRQFWASRSRRDSPAGHSWRWLSAAEITLMSTRSPMTTMTFAWLGLHLTCRLGGPGAWVLAGRAFSTACLPRGCPGCLPVQDRSPGGASGTAVAWQSTAAALRVEVQPTGDEITGLKNASVRAARRPER